MKSSGISLLYCVKIKAGRQIARWYCSLGQRKVSLNINGFNSKLYFQFWNQKIKSHPNFIFKCAAKGLKRSVPSCFESIARILIWNINMLQKVLNGWYLSEVNSFSYTYKEKIWNIERVLVWYRWQSFLLCNLSEVNSPSGESLTQIVSRSSPCAWIWKINGKTKWKI